MNRDQESEINRIRLGLGKTQNPSSPAPNFSSEIPLCAICGGQGVFSGSYDEGGGENCREYEKDCEACDGRGVHPQFLAGFIVCREYMARFVSHQSPQIAQSIRANWLPQLGTDFGFSMKEQAP